MHLIRILRTSEISTYTEKIQFFHIPPFLNLYSRRQHMFQHKKNKPF